MGDSMYDLKNCSSQLYELPNDMDLDDVNIEAFHHGISPVINRATIV